MTTTTPGAAVTTPACRPLRKDAVRNRELLLAAAGEVFAQRGLDASLDEVARHAGLGVATAYRHFANKHELARALMEHRVDQIVAAVERAQDDPDPLSGLTTFLRSTIAAQSADRGLRQVLLGIHDPCKAERVHDRLAPGIDALVRRAQAAGQIRPEVDPTDLGMVVVMLASVGDTAAQVSPQLWRRYFTLCLDGLCTQRRPAAELAEVPALTREEFRAAMAGPDSGVSC